jgi:hypothetical protein
MGPVIIDNGWAGDHDAKIFTPGATTSGCSLFTNISNKYEGILK